MMTISMTLSRPFEPGTTGWTIDDLNDPKIERMWESGAYEIVEGVLATMPPAYYDGALPLNRLRRLIERYLDVHELEGEFTTEVDLIAGQKRVIRPDMMFMTPQDHQRQQAANARHGKQSLKFGRILVPPTMILESVSLGHEAHDRETKRLWYAEFGVPNYWIIDGFARNLECLILDGADYRLDQAGRDKEEIRPSMFPGLSIPLGQVWV